MARKRVDLTPGQVAALIEVCEFVEAQGREYVGLHPKVFTAMRRAHEALRQAQDKK